MGIQWDTNLPGNSGVRPRNVEVDLVAHDAITAGTVYTLDVTTALTATHGVATDSAAAVDGATEGTIWVLALETLASGATGKFLLQGYADVTNDGTDLAAGAALSSTATGVVIAAPAGDVIIAYNATADTTTAGGGAASGKCWFDGTGFHVKHA